MNAVDLPGLRAWAAGSDEIDWGLLPLPPCVNAVLNAAGTATRRARVNVAYYEPEAVLTLSRDGAGRQRRITAGQVVLVAPDGSILATWRDEALTPPPVVPEPRDNPSRRRGGPGPRDRDSLLAMLAAEGVRVEETVYHLRVFTPSRVRVYLTNGAVSERVLRCEVSLLRRHGCSLRHIP